MHDTEPGELVADYAHIAASDYGPCQGCSWPMYRGQRIARLADGTEAWIHTNCVSTSDNDRHG